MTETHTLRCPTFQQHGDVRTIMQQHMLVVQRHCVNEWELMDRQDEATPMYSTTPQLMTLSKNLIKKKQEEIQGVQKLSGSPILLLNYCSFGIFLKCQYFFTSKTILMIIIKVIQLAVHFYKTDKT